MKCGLVLEGGGAKGAYQIGCLRALSENSVKIDAVAGTSVGALNGILVGYDRLPTGETYWGALGVRSVLRARWKWLPVYPLFLLNLVSYKVRESESLPPLTLRNFRITAALFLVMTAVVLIVPAEGDNGSGGDIPRWGWAGYIACFYGAVLVLWTAYSLLSRARFSLFEPTPLRRFLEDLMAVGNPRVPVYVTLARESLAFDPDSPRLFYGKNLKEDVVWAAVEGEYAFPRYIQLCTLSQANRVNATVASAALPVGIFPSVTLDELTYVDGGVADNLPMYPLLQYEKCEELIVVALRPWTVDALKEHWQQIDRLMRLQELGLSEAHEMYEAELERRGGDRHHAERFNPPVNLPLIDAAFWPKRIVLVCPDRKLGGFLTGTLRFSRRYASRLMLRGYQDATMALRANGLSRD